MEEIRRLKERLLDFRSQITRAYNANKGKLDGFNIGIVAITGTLLHDFDKYFNSETLKDSKDIQPLIEKYCYPFPKCPICNTDMRIRINDDPTCWICSKYPDCDGEREQTGEVIVNDALRIYLTRKRYEDTIQTNTPRSRFRNLDI